MNNKKNTAVQYVKLTLRFFKEDNQWIGECLETGITTYGDTIDEVQKELPELITLHFNSIEDMGDMEDCLKKNGITLLSSNTPEKIDISAPYLPGAIYEPYFKDMVEV